MRVEMAAEAGDDGSRSWLARMAGRRFHGPFRGQQWQSLAEWLAAKDAPESPGRQPVLPASPPGAAPPDRREAPAPASLLGSEAGAKRRREQRRRLHPTVRGGLSAKIAELAGESEDEVAAGGGGDAPRTRAGPDFAIFEDYAAGVVIGPGSIFSHRPAAATDPRPMIVAGLTIASPARRGGGACDGDALILPRVRSRPTPESGRVATVHASQEGTSALLARYAQRSGGALSPPSPQSRQQSPRGLGSGEAPADRKWHLRQACLSASLARREPEVLSEASPSTGSLTSPPSVRSLTSVAPTTLSHSASSVALGSSEYLDFQGWGLDDDYVRSLLRRIRLGAMRQVNFGDNRLTEATVRFLSEGAKVQGLSSLVSLRISKNSLGPPGGYALKALLQEARPPLKELDLADNSLGDGACEVLCECLATTCKQLVGLSLARNQIGDLPKAGVALGSLIGASSSLQALDLHWNRLHGAGAAAVAQGLHDNACQIDGQLWRVNLAWNRLGLRCRKAAGAVDCRCEVCKLCTKIVATLASAFAEGKVLFHLDLSYNQFGAEDSATLADGLRRNHTLFGLHFQGNHASVDDIGILVPRLTDEPSLLTLAADEDVKQLLQVDDVRSGINASVRHTPRQLRLDRMGHFGKSGMGAVGSPERVRDLALTHAYINPSLMNIATPDAFSQQDLEHEKSWVTVHGRVQQASDFSGPCRFEDVRIDERCCWICENWVEQTITYVPGWSGPEASPDEVSYVFAYFSIDGFTRPSRLCLTSERYFRRNFAASAVGGAARPAGGMEGTLRKPAPLVNDQGRYVLFKGSRMLPPSAMPIQVIFQVNEKFTTATSMKTATLFPPRDMQLHSERPQEAVSPTLPPLPVPLGQFQEVFFANTISIGVSALRRFEQGSASALCLMEDPRLRADLSVVPRKLQYDKAPGSGGPWTFEKSSFRDFVRDTDAAYHAAFDHDFAESKLQSHVEKQVHGKPAAQALLNHVRAEYKFYVAAFHGFTFQGYTHPRRVAGLPLSCFIGFLGSRAETAEPPPESSGRSRRAHRHAEADGEQQVFASSFPKSAAEAIYVGACIQEGDGAKERAGLPSRGLARFQFLEAFVRVGLQRYCKHGAKDAALVAMQELEKATNVGRDVVYFRTTLHDAMLSEECDMVVKQHRRMLEQVFVSFSKRLPLEPRERAEQLMSFGAWMEFLRACGAAEFGCDADDGGLAFALGRQLTVDEFRAQAYRSMKLSFCEFLMCLGAVVRLSGNFDPKEFPDRLLDFVEEHVSRTARPGGAPMIIGRAGSDMVMAKLCALASEAFDRADEDHDGYVDFQSFQAALRPKQCEKLLRELSFSAEDFRVAFRKADATGSGKVSLDELLEAVEKTRRGMAGTDRVVAVLRKLFEDTESSTSGKMPAKGLFGPSARTQLSKAGMAADEVDDLALMLEAKDSKHGVCFEDVVLAYLSLHGDGSRASRATNFLWSVCREADTDGSNTLSRAELESAVDERVTERIKQLGLTVPDWARLFDALDINGDGQLTWEELVNGVRAIWGSEEERST